MEIKPIDLTVKSLLESDFYKIPRFQRPYSWDRENVEEFWNDAIVADDPDYFIGSFVVHKGSAAYSPVYVVDGQQRLTTITILLAAVRDVLDGAGLKSKANGIQQLIERQDLDDQPAYVLQTETSYPYFHEHIQKHGSPGQTDTEIGEEEEALKRAYDFLRGRLHDELARIRESTSSTEVKKQKEVEAYLQRVRDQTLRLQLILIKLTREDDAYLIFETLNTRGKDLTVADLVKNHFTRLLKPTNKGVDLARDKWRRVLDVFESSKADLDVNRFLHHTWLSRHQYIGEKVLFKEMRKLVGKSNAQQALDELLDDAKIYRTVFEPESRKWKKEESEVLLSLRALQVFRVMQPAPVLLSLLRAYFDEGLTLKQLRTTLNMMENFHFKFTAMTAQRTGGGTGKMYAQVARSLAEASSKDKRAKTLADFLKRLRERVPKEGEFTDGILGLRYSDENTKQKSLVRYTLTRLDRHFRAGAPVDYDKMTIEHIAPQHPKAGTAIARMAEIGNLILVPEKLNSEVLQNKSFAEKKKLMKDNGVPFDATLSSSGSHWGDVEVAARGKAIATLAYNEIFKV